MNKCTLGVKKRSLNPLEEELRVVVSYPIWMLGTGLGPQKEIIIT